MDLKKSLGRIKEIYDNGENIIAYLKKGREKDNNSSEDILISYDFQAGSYSESYNNNSDIFKLYHQKIAKIIAEYVGSEMVILEAGVGEATTLGPVIKKIGLNKFKKVYGFDISWSRIKYAEKFCEGIFGERINKISLFVGNLKEIPIKNNSVDIVYTVHAIEPNGGSEREILEELYRIVSKYLILFEPAYELADEPARNRMKSHGYITNLYNTAIGLGYKVESYKLLGVSLNSLNPTGVMIIRKESQCNKVENVLCDPVTKGDLIFDNNVAFCEESLLAYPIVSNIPILDRNNAIIATKYMEFN